MFSYENELREYKLLPIYIYDLSKKNNIIYKRFYFDEKEVRVWHDIRKKKPSLIRTLIRTTRTTTRRREIFMGLFDFLKKKEDPRHQLEEEDRIAGGETRSIKSQLNRAKAELEIAKLRLEAERDQIRLRAEIEEARQDLEDLTGAGEEEESGGGSPEDALLTAFLSKIMQGQQQQPAQIVVQPQAAPLDLEEEQFKEIWKKIPNKYKDTAKKMSDEQIKAYINGSLPGSSEDSLNRAVAFVRRQ